MHRMVIAICVIGVIGTATWAAPLELSNEQLAIGFDVQDGYAISSLVHRTLGVEFIAPRPDGVEQDRSPWAVAIRLPSGLVHVLTARDARSASHSLQGDTLTVTWQHVGQEQTQADLTVTVAVTLPPGSAKCYWSVTVSGSSAGALWQVDCPRVFGVRSIGDDQMCKPVEWGRLVYDPTRTARNETIGYPQPASMQWFAYWGTPDRRTPPLEEQEGRVAINGWSPDRSDAAGLYWGAEDGEFYWKRFHIERAPNAAQLAFWIENIPPLERWPITATQPEPVNYQPPYRNVLAVFTGDWQDAAALYRDWARDQVWCRRGTADQWPDEMPAPGSDELVQWVPGWFRSIGFWAKFYHEPAKILPEWAAYRKWLRVPMASHWYRYHISVFNDNDPEHLPGDPYLLQGARDALAMGVRPLPYVLSTIWDSDTQSYFRENAVRAAMLDEDGTPYPWRIGEQMFHWMCPATEQWRAKIRETCAKLILEHGMAGVYLDVLAAGGARGCYSTEHGHPVHGGNYQFTGNRQLMVDLRSHIRRLKPDAAFFAEGIDEVYNDIMDGYLTLDFTRMYEGNGEQVWPIWTAVYHPYAINFGADPVLSMEPDVYGVIYGHQLIWGSQPLHSDSAPKPPAEGDPTSEMFRDFTQAYYVAGQRFLMGGEWLRLAVRPQDAPAGQCGLELAAARHVVAYDLSRDRRRIWTGPAVLGSAWRRQGDIGVVLANITGQAQQVELTVREEVLGLDGGARLLRAWPLQPESIGPAAGSHDLTIAPRSAAVYVITTDVDRALRLLNPLEETEWELLLVEDGPLGSVSGPVGSLYACSDGPVVNTTTPEGTTATPYYYDNDGRLQPRQGRQANPHGAAAEGKPLPRQAALQPFALLRRLPHTATPGGRGVLVLSGDDRHLSCVAPAGTQLSFSGPGLAIVSDPRTGRLLRGLGEGLTDKLTLPDSAGEWLVGYARFDPDEVRGLLRSGGAGLGARVHSWAERLIALAEAPAGAREAELATASREFVELAQSLSDAPGALSPVSPLTALHDRLQALLRAQLAALVRLEAEDDWISPGISKPLTVAIHDDPGRYDHLEAIELVAVGDWREGGLVFAEQDVRVQMPGARRAFRPSITLRDGLYVERVIPVIACARAQREGHEYCLTDVLWLEANRPFEIKTDLEPLTVVAGGESSAQVKLRNWSPQDVSVSFTAVGPEGWVIAPPPEPMVAPALKYSTVPVRVHVPKNATRGLYQVQLTANHTEDEDKAVYASLTVSVLDAVEPVVTGGEWAQPKDNELAQMRQAVTMVLYAQQGEQISIRLDNVRVTRYVDSLSYELLGPDLRVMDKGAVKVDNSHTLELAAPLTGTYYLRLNAKQGSVVVRSANRYLAECATAEAPLRLYNSDVTRYFLVPEGATGFAVGGRDGGPDETARVVITSPQGRVAFEHDGNWSGGEKPVQVLPAEAGKIWTVRIEPVQDFSIWLSGAVSPYLATSPERVLAPAQ